MEPNRRQLMGMLGTTAGFGATIGVGSASALASEESRAAQNPEQEVVKRTDTYTVIKSDYNNETNYFKIYTAGEQKGRVEKLEQWSDRGVGVQRLPEGVVENYRHVTRTFDTCCPFFYKRAESEPYDHQQNSVALKLTKTADAFGKATLTETFSAIAGLVLSTNVYGILATIGFGAIVTTAVSVGTGRNYTFSTHDDHYDVPLACEKPRVITGVANSFGAFPNETVPVSPGKGYIDGKHMGSVDYDNPITWNGKVKYPDCRNC